MEQANKILTALAVQWADQQGQEVIEIHIEKKE